MTVLRAAVAAGVSALALATPVVAAPIEASGTGTVEVRSVATIRQADGNVIQERTITGTVSGALEGTYVEHVRGVIQASGRLVFHGTLTFTGTVAGCGSGTVALALEGRGIAGAPLTEGRLATTGQNSLGLHGTGTFAQSATSIAYEAQFVCA
jgi:hypothetical protein